MEQSVDKPRYLGGGEMPLREPPLPRIEGGQAKNTRVEYDTFLKKIKNFAFRKLKVLRRIVMRNNPPRPPGSSGEQLPPIRRRQPRGRKGGRGQLSAHAPFLLFPPSPPPPSGASGQMRAPTFARPAPGQYFVRVRRGCRVEEREGGERRGGKKKEKAACAVRARPELPQSVRTLRACGKGRPLLASARRSVFFWLSPASHPPTHPRGRPLVLRRDGPAFSYLSPPGLPPL